MIRIPVACDGPGCAQQTTALYMHGVARADSLSARDWLFHFEKQLGKFERDGGDYCSQACWKALEALKYGDQVKP